MKLLEFVDETLIFQRFDLLGGYHLMAVGKLSQFLLLILASQVAGHCLEISLKILHMCCHS